MKGKKQLFLANQSLVQELTSRLDNGAQVLSAGDLGWDQALKSFNKDAQSQTPSLYVRCKSEKDVVECVRFARQNNISLTPRSGCHNLGNFSLLYGGLVIDVKQLNKISHSLEEKSITYQTGCRFGQVDDYISKQLPGYAYVGAMDPSIGTAGARCALGVGWLQRLLGNGIDNIISAKIVLADGQVVRASQDHNQDLLQAIKGAGSNFGIVVQLTEKIHYVLDPQQRQEVRFAAHFYPINVAQQVYDKIYEISFRKDFPDEAFMLPVLHFVNGQPGLSIFFCHYRFNTQTQTIDTSQHWTQKQLRQISKDYNGISINSLGNQDGWGSITHKTLQEKAMNIPWGSSFYPCGGFVSDQNVKTVTSSLISHWKNSKIPEFSKNVPFHSTSFYHFGGKAQRKRNPKHSAWPGNHDTALLAVTWGGWINPAEKTEMIAWVKDQWNPLIKDLQFGYLCASAYDWNSKGFSEFVYGDNYGRLSALKRKYDPQNVFRHNVNIPPQKN